MAGGQDSIKEVYLFRIDKELHLYQNILPLFGFANSFLATLVFFKGLFLFFIFSRLWKFLQEILAERLPVVNYPGEGWNQRQTSAANSFSS